MHSPVRYDAPLRGAILRLASDSTSASVNRIRMTRTAAFIAELFQECVEFFFDLVVQVRRGAVEDPGGFSGAVEEEHGGHGGDVAEGLSGGSIGDSKTEIRAERGDRRANLSFGGLDGESDDGEVVA